MRIEKLTKQEIIGAVAVNSVMGALVQIKFIKKLVNPSELIYLCKGLLSSDDYDELIEFILTMSTTLYEMEEITSET